ncbi:TIGR01777 family oxidoreductase [Pelagibius marinus]|uniref:TIGR01777 family oxidoreductase n=1 Tax=Pelagibius marinus TaxID=2762760 RepID=UPI001872EFD4|nr:TIGR01777 family oxidoreductase [Pelagibius marinus]
MFTPLLATLITLQIAFGTFDMVFHHEATERLAWRPSQRRELLLHALRNLIYGGFFLCLAWLQPQGFFALALIAVLLIEVAITLWDFVEEDRTRKLPETERVLHTLLALNYGAILVLLLPGLADWASRPAGLLLTGHGLWSWFLSLASLGVTLFGLRDLFAARRVARLRETDPLDLVNPAETPRHILVTGGTGFIGRRLVAALVAAGHDVTVLTRDPKKAADLPTPLRIVTRLEQINSDTPLDAVVNLAGEPIANGLWTKAKKRKIVASRVGTTRRLVDWLADRKERPGVLVNASAVGWYGLRGDETLTENDTARVCFTQEVCVRWEQEARKAERLGLRVVRLRIGLVLGREGGLLASMLTPFEFGLGGRLGHGQQWMSWIMRDDLVRLIVHALDSEDVEGAVNATAPHPVRNADFTRALGRALGRPALAALPAWLLRLGAGDFARELLLGGQRVVPAKAEASGFVFRYPTLQPALNDVVGAAAPAAAKPACPVRKVIQQGG